MTRPTDGRRPGGHGRRTGELKAQRHPDPEAKAAERRLRVMRDPLWEVQPGETAKAYQAFRVYRDIGPSRTIKRAAEVLEMQINEKHPTNAPSNALSEYSARYRWVERCRAYDAYLDTVLLAAQEGALRDASRRWVARQEQIREREYTLAMGLADKVAEMLKYPITQQKHRTESRNGKIIHYTIVEPARWDWKAAADILQKIGYQARLSADMVTDGARAPSPDMTDRGVSDIDAWLEEIGVTAQQNDLDAAAERQ